MTKKIVLSTGGTGGHIFPMIALYDYLISKNYDVSFVTDQRGEKYFTDDVKQKIKIFKLGCARNDKKSFPKDPKTVPKLSPSCLDPDAHLSNRPLARPTIV